MRMLTPELQSATLAAILTGVMWVPIIVNRLSERGAWTALRNPQPDVRPDADWAYRLACAHRNAIENLVVYAPLAIGVHVMGLGDSLTAAAGTVFLAARLSHAILYTLGVPLLRTIAFAAGFCAQAILAIRLLGFN